ncbi:MAG: universal stress protein [Planctomycetota bacterium]
MKIHTILAPTDFSWGSSVSSRTAVSLAEKLAAKVQLLHVVECPPVFAYAPIGDGTAAEWSHNDETLSRGRDQLAKFREGLQADVEVECQTVLGLGNTGGDIVKVAESCAADLIVMATHGRTGFAHALIGSIAERVVRTAKCPVLTLKAPEQRNAPSMERSQVRRILYATDLSESSHEALLCAQYLRDLFDAELDALFVMENLEQYPSIPWEYLPIPGNVTLPQHQAEQAEARLREHVAAAGPVNTILRRGTSYHEIVDQAHASQADVIVLSTHGHTGLRHTLLGSVAEKVVRLAQCPVLTLAQS